MTFVITRNALVFRTRDDANELIERLCELHASNVEYEPEFRKYHSERLAAVKALDSWYASLPWYKKWIIPKPAKLPVDQRYSVKKLGTILRKVAYASDLIESINSLMCTEDPAGGPWVMPVTDDQMEFITTMCMNAKKI